MTVQPNFLPPEIKEYLEINAFGSTYRKPFLSMPAVTWPNIAKAAKDRVFVGLISVVIIFAALFGYQTLDALYRVYSLKSVASAAMADLGGREFSQLDDHMVLAHNHLVKLDRDLQWLSKLGFMPVIGPEITAASDKAEASADLIKVFYPVSEILSKTDGDVKYVSPAQKKQIINTIASHSGELKAISTQLGKGGNDWLPAEFNTLSASVADLAAISSELPKMLGVEKDAHYLVLFANNLEIRPGGGFIGSYAVVTVRDGTIIDVYVNDSYALYRSRDISFGTPAPAPMQKYLQVPTMHFRDSNWSPDYPTTVELVKKAYALEQGEHAAEIDGVITVSTEILREILAITGPATVRGVTFSERNAINTLQHQVDVAIWYNNTPYADRKDIIGELASTLHKQIENFSFKQNEQLFKKVSNLADEKHIAFSFNNPVAQKLVAEKGWDGKLPSYNSDTLMVVDTNFFGGKTEHLMQKAYNYKVREKGGKLIAELQLKYKHTGYPAPLVHDYRTYLRVYVPSGSKLISNSGNLTDVSSGSEFGRTVFGGLATIPIGQERVITLTYELPANVYEGDYSLQVQKQIGAFPAQLRLDIQFGKINQVINDELDSDKFYQID